MSELKVDTITPNTVAVIDAPWKVLQVLQATKTDTFTTSATSYTDITDLSISITPAATTSKILVIASVNGQGRSAAAHVGVRLMRDSTAIAVGDAASSRTSESAGAYQTDPGGSAASMVTTWLDSPSTTSAVVYKVQGYCDSSNTLYINRTQSDTDASDYGRTVSTITVMEIGA